MYMSSWLLAWSLLSWWLSWCEHCVAGFNWAEQANARVNVPQKSSFSKNDTSTSHFGLAVSSLCPNDANDQPKVSGTGAPRPTPPVIGKQFCGHNGAELSGEPQIRNGRPKGDTRPRTQLLPRYWSRIHDQELQKISGQYPNVGQVVLKFL